MSFVRDYKSLCQIDIKNSVSNEVISGFEIEPTPACKITMSNHHIVFKKNDGGFSLYYTMNPMADNPVLGEISVETKFEFAVQFPNGLLSMFYPDLTELSGPQFLFENKKNNGDLILVDSRLSQDAIVSIKEGIRTKKSVFDYFVDMADTPTKVLIKNKFSNNIVKEILIKSVSDPALVNVNLEEKDSGIYKLTNDSVGAEEKMIYINDVIASQGVSAVVNIYFDKAQNTVPNDGIKYSIKFKPR